MILPSGRERLLTAQQHFSQVPAVSIERSKFDRSHGHKTTFNEGFLIPFLVDEVLPGDTFNVRVNMFCRLTTPLKPIMDNMYLDTFFFFVPMRLLWTHWEKFNGAQDNPGDSTSFTVPTMTVPVGGPGVNTLLDYMGVPTSAALITGSFPIAAFHTRAYNLIWNTWFRDENQQNSVVVDTGDGPDTFANYVLKRRGKRFDYFTSCLPSPQKGTAVSIPVGATSAPVNRVLGAGAWHAYDAGGNVLSISSALQTDAGGLGKLQRTAGATDISLDPSGGLTADLSSALATTINQLRLAEQTQVMLERDARGGTRYIEIIKSHFGVVSPDARMQRPEYLGGGSSPINIHPVPQTAPQQAAGVTTAQGNLAGFGTASAVGHGFNKSFTEHGVLIGLVCVHADLTYQQGLHRMWSRSTRFDYYWPALSHIGEQAVLNKEIFLQGTAADNTAFGYQERFAEYRYFPSIISGAFRSQFATPLDFWHLSQNFTVLPVLGDTFIVENAPLARCVAVTSEPHFYMDAFFQMTTARPMPVYGVPGLGSRF